MAPTNNSLLDPSLCSCFIGPYRYPICNKIKWSTLSLSTALLIIVIYLSSGLYALIDVTTLATNKSYQTEDVLWSIASSSLTSILGWVSVAVYFTVVLFVMILICGIQLAKPWILFIWSLIMIFMLIADGLVSVLCLREYQQQNYRSIKQIKILFFVLSIRLIVSLCGIFVTVFHFRRLNKVQSEQRNRQRMLEQYHSHSSSPSYPDTWSRSIGFRNPSKDNNNDDDRYVTDLPGAVSLPRAKVSTLHYQPTSNIFQSYNEKFKYMTQFHQRGSSKHEQNDFRYNVPLQERFHQQNLNNIEQF